MPRFTTHHELFGPVPGDGYVFNYHPTGFTALTGYTANSKEFYFNHPHPEPVWAQWLLVWCPTGPNQAARLTQHYNSPPVEIARINANQSATPIVQSANVTAALQAARNSNSSQYFTAEYQTNGVNIRLFESRLTILWDW